ncbi:cytochrome P450 [Tepidiforma bonchosmolovskayae]|jgi:cytochrome P450|uniref:Cytochrome P450 n=1 Tax=Tepidiforma bonchosmolovskayae TaxID=2601677 RepID=A0ABX6C2S4_9CHLR|nr:cytochrome P450 [Tepidiforma bonchosmolovskayae]QFG02736.1 cytochrome P450 [Tepidiforma bonchosmolovskayae]
MVAAPNVNDPAFLENPFPFYELGRAMSPLVLPDRGLAMVFGYDDCAAILKDWETWSSRFPPPPDVTDPPEPTMLNSDPPRHTRLRSLVSQAFTPRMVEQLEPRIREITRELLEPALEAGACDLVAALAYPLPVIVIAEILGIPPEDRAQFKEWSDEVVASLGTGLGGGRQVRAEVFEEMREYFTRMTEERRRHPRNDLITGLVEAEQDGERLTFPDLLQMLILLLVAGNETTTNLISNAMLSFMEHRDELAKVEANPALIPSALEEVLRFNSPVQATARRPTRDVELRGRTIPAGMVTLVWLAAANRDPAQFPEPLRFDVTRSPNRHLAFGMGIHFCLGAPLARLEARVAYEELLGRATGFERTTDGPLPRVPTFFMRGVLELPIAFRRR